MMVDPRPIPTKNVVEHRLHQVLNNSLGVVTLLVRIVALHVPMTNDQTVDIILPALPINEVVHVYRVTIGRGVRRHVVHVLVV